MEWIVVADANKKIDKQFQYIFSVDVIDATENGFGSILVGKEYFDDIKYKEGIKIVLERLQKQKNTRILLNTQNKTKEQRIGIVYTYNDNNTLEMIRETGLEICQEVEQIAV